MRVGQTVDFTVNRDLVRAAKITKIHGNGKVDLMVFTHPDDYPEFSQMECQVGNGVRREIEQGTGPNTFQVLPDPSNPVDLTKITTLETKVATLETDNSTLKTEVLTLQEQVTNLSALQAPAQP